MPTHKSGTFANVKIKTKVMREFPQINQYTPKHAKLIVDRDSAWVASVPRPFDAEKPYKKFRGR